ncbi:MAG: RDD family protein [Flavobacteriaceae bacterium]|jgi:uncharacterized RDD family membrane protein YckC|nr:RDD family protein [Flavobacteriaceae bacterium]
MTQSNFIKSSRKRRIAAYVIDHFVLTFLMVAILFLFSRDVIMDWDNPEEIVPVLLSVLVPGFILYFGKDSYRGISVGKWMMGIMVRDENDFNKVPSINRLFLRNLFLMVWPMEFIVLAISEQKKRLGDTVAKTVVLRNSTQSSKAFRIIAIISVVMMFSVFMLFIVGGTMKKSDAYKIAIEEIEKNERLKMETGTIVGYGMIPSGSIKVGDGYGEALLEIKVIGEKETIPVVVYLEKDMSGKWQLREMQKEDGTDLKEIATEDEINK